ncbi:MAG: hypothetical protein WDN46_01775 [Methylocella sp.]
MPLPVAKVSFLQSAAAAEAGHAPDAGPEIPQPPTLATTERSQNMLSNLGLTPGVEAPSVSNAREVAYDLDVIYADGQIWKILGFVQVGPGETVPGNPSDYIAT